MTVFGAIPNRMPSPNKRYFQKMVPAAGPNPIDPKSRIFFLNAEEI
jgi:hypothetical protein